MIYPFRKKFDQLFLDFEKSEVEIIQNNCENGFYSKRYDNNYVNRIYNRHQRKNRNTTKKRSEQTKVLLLNNVLKGL